jgi:hypothetical protein
MAGGTGRGLAPTRGLVDNVCDHMEVLNQNPRSYCYCIRPCLCVKARGEVHTCFQMEIARFYGLHMTTFHMGAEMYGARSYGLLHMTTTGAGELKQLLNG